MEFLNSTDTSATLSVGNSAGNKPQFAAATGLRRWVCASRTADSFGSGPWCQTLLVLAALLFAPAGPVMAQISDSFDGGRPRFQLAGSDCGAVVTEQDIHLTGGYRGSPAESISIVCGHGSRADLIYPIPPSVVISELTGELWLRSSRSGIRVGMRVVFPHAVDPATGQRIETVVWGSAYAAAGTPARLTVGNVVEQLDLRRLALRSQFGASTDFSGAYVDAVLLNAYAGVGRTDLLVDQLNVNGQVPFAAVARAAPPGDPAAVQRSTGAAFPADSIRRIIEHRGESFAFLKSLGFDTVLLTEPLSSDLLRRAAEAGVDLICPRPQYVLSSLQGGLDRVIAYALPGSLAGDQLDYAKSEKAAVGSLPVAWQRPLIMAAVERWEEYSLHADGFIADLPPPTRGLSGDEQVAILDEWQSASGPGMNWIVSVDSNVPPELRSQIDAAARVVGGQPSGEIRWHHQLTRAFHALSCKPRGILYRSDAPLDSGASEAESRAAAMRIVNRMLFAVEPVAAGGLVERIPQPSHVEHRVYTIRKGPATLLVAVQSDPDGSYASRGTSGQVLHIPLPPAIRAVSATRLTDGRAERLTPETGPQGAALQIVSPDLVELVCFTDSLQLPDQLSRRIELVASDAGYARWQLVADALLQTQTNWQALSRGVPGGDRSMPATLLAAAAHQLADAERYFHSGRLQEALRLTRRADAWEQKARAAFASRVRPEGPPLQSLPTVQSPDGLALQLAWPPASNAGRWQPILIAGAAMEQSDELIAAGWQVDRRLTERANTSITFASRSPAQGLSSLLLSSEPRPGHRLMGGYAGTSVRLQSPAISVPPDHWVRMDVKVRTGLGFGGADQGILLYDSEGGPSLGVLARQTDGWQTVRLYRVSGASPIRFMAELAGAGEASIDDFRVSFWQPQQPQTTLPLRAITPELATSSSGGAQAR